MQLYKRLIRLYCVKSLDDVEYITGWVEEEQQPYLERKYANSPNKDCYGFEEKYVAV